MANPNDVIRVPARFEVTPTTITDLDEFAYSAVVERVANAGDNLSPEQIYGGVDGVINDRANGSLVRVCSKTCSAVIDSAVGSDGETTVRVVCGPFKTGTKQEAEKRRDVCISRHPQIIRLANRVLVDILDDEQRLTEEISEAEATLQRARAKLDELFKTS